MILERALRWAAVALGVASLAVVVAALAYASDQLLRRRRYAALAVSALVVAAALTAPGAWMVGVACAIVVSAQAACYLYFTGRTLLRSRATRSWDGPLPAIAVVVPARDEAAVLEETLASLDTLDYPPGLLEIVVIDDGSTDATRAIATGAAARMRHRTRVVPCERSGGKARRLNEVIPSLTADFVLILDADHLVPRDLLTRMLAGFVGRPDVACVQIASAVRNGGDGLLTKMLELEYMCRCRAIYPGKAMGVFVGSGGLFRRSTLLDVGGFDPAMLTEDVEISYRLYAAGMRVAYEDDTQSRDLAPSTLSSFFRQRHRWMRGVWQAMLLHVGKSSAALARVRLYFVQFTLDGFGALCLCGLEIDLAFTRSPALLHVAQASVSFMIASCAAAFCVGAIRGGRARDLLYLPLTPLYFVVHSIPMTWALIDNYLLAKAFVWIKTDRGREPEPPVDVSRGRA